MNFKPAFLAMRWVNTACDVARVRVVLERTEPNHTHLVFCDI